MDIPLGRLHFGESRRQAQAGKDPDELTQAAQLERGQKALPHEVPTQGGKHEVLLIFHT